MKNNDTTTANIAHANARIATLQQIDTAVKLGDTALVSGLRMTVTNGATSKDEVAAHFTRCANPGVYASDFNKGDKAQRIIGEAATLALIDKACEGKGAAYTRAKAALAAVIATAKDAGVKELRGKAANTATRDAIKAADAAVAKKAANRKPPADKPATPGKPPAIADSAAKLAEAAMQVGTTHKSFAYAIKAVMQQARKLSAPEGRDTAHAEAMAALATACEAWQVFAK
jgi:hypothetical protein